MRAHWRNVTVPLRVGERIHAESVRLSLPQHRVVEMVCADILELEMEPTVTEPGHVAREMFRLARPEVGRVSRFGPTDPFYRAIEQAESDARIERSARADAERFRRQIAALPLPTPVVDRDPGDEDGATP